MNARPHYYAANHNMNEPLFAIEDTKHRHGGMMREVLRIRLQLETLDRAGALRNMRPTTYHSSQDPLLCQEGPTYPVERFVSR